MRPVFGDLDTPAAVHTKAPDKCLCSAYLQV